MSGLSGKFLDFGNFLYCLESFSMVCFHIVWKVSRMSGKFPDCSESNFYCLESIQFSSTVSGLSGKFMQCMTFLCNVLKVVGLSGKFTDGLEPFQIVRKEFVLS